MAKNKLRLKKAKILYLSQGVELKDPTWLTSCKISQDSLIFVSCGEGYVGQTEDSNGTATTANNDSLNLDSLQLNSEETPPATVLVLAKKSFVDPDANVQLNRTAMLPGNQHPIGATFITQKIIYPALIGNDIGCGMAVYKTRLSSTIKPQKIVDKLHHLEGRWTEGDPHAFLISKLGDQHTETGKAHLDQLGTVGGGNHFAEFVVVETLVDQELCNKFGLVHTNTYLIVHSGSRKYGQTVLDYANSMQNNKAATATTAAGKKQQQFGIDPDSEIGQEYLRQHDLACAWAKTNRELIAHRVLSRLNAEEDAERILDIWHNNVERKIIENVDPEKPCWIHRKGAAPSDRGLVVIPGSRGHFSYLVMPQGEQGENGFSLAHGAGRLLPRAKALQKRPQSSKQASISAMQTTNLGSSVICEDTDLLFEEQPDAYKEITDIIDDLGPYVKVVAILRPICTYKMRKENRSADTVSVIYLNDTNGEIAREDAPFNTCFASERAFIRYSYLNFAPNNATINFYSDSSCQDFVFGLDGYYGGYPGPARSYRWVGWTDDYLGDIFDKEPIRGQGEAATGAGTNVPPDGKHPGHLKDDDSNSDNGGAKSSSSTFFGGVIGSMVILSVGGVAFWKIAGKKLVEDKGKSVLPYHRGSRSGGGGGGGGGGGRDGDILLTANDQGNNSFELGDEDLEDDDEDEDENDHHRSGRQERYRDDDNV
ncbi:hypothetical protein BGZ65_011138 [Modicella reniformis]|uniref:3'-phosphate/5'-hydroxy nucleic acid ligase n=1 Tax=Modicella reniformis TaxID=1440133 RepID=A0A9P6MAM3_9FUNG|nr:hypothetical protein BGZ65_011138 [Modicella reniformis]